MTMAIKDYLPPDMSIHRAIKFFAEVWSGKTRPYAISISATGTEHLNISGKIRSLAMDTLETRVLAGGKTPDYAVAACAPGRYDLVDRGDVSISAYHESILMNAKGMMTNPAKMLASPLFSMLLRTMDERYRSLPSAKHHYIMIQPAFGDVKDEVDLFSSLDCLTGELCHIQQETRTPIMFGMSGETSSALTYKRSRFLYQTDLRLIF